MTQYIKNKPCIYKITSPTGRIYIGQTVDIHRRIIHYRNGHCKKQDKLNKSFLKHGFNKHIIEVILYCAANELNNIERFFQDKYDASNNFNLNIKLIRSSDRSGYLGQSIKDKIGIANSGHKNGMYGRVIKESSRQLQRDKLTGSNNYLSKLIFNSVTGIYYDCLNEAAFSINMKKPTLWVNLKINKINKTNFIYA